MSAKAEPGKFEETFRELQAVVETLESDRISLEEALAAYEKGMALLKQCASILEEAELRVEQLSKDGSGQFHVDETELSPED